MTQEPRFSVIHNPLKLIFKYEVWYAGIVREQDYGGEWKDRFVTKAIKSFYSQEIAEAYVEYQLNVIRFRKETNEQTS